MNFGKLSSALGGLGNANAQISPTYTPFFQLLGDKDSSRWRGYFEDGLTEDFTNYNCVLSGNEYQTDGSTAYLSPGSNLGTSDGFTEFAIEGVDKFDHVSYAEKRDGYLFFNLFGEGYYPRFGQRASDQLYFQFKIDGATKSAGGTSGNYKDSRMSNLDGPAETSPGLQAGVPFHYVITWKGSEGLQIYINNAEKLNASVPGTKSDGGTGVPYIARDTNTGYYHDGGPRMLTIHNVHKTAADVSQMYTTAQNLGLLAI